MIKETQKKQILLVEDEIITAEHLKTELEQAGYIVDVHYEGETAVDKVRNTDYKPDLIIMDVKLRSLMDGVQAAELIKMKYNIPIIFLTAYLSADLVERAKNVSPYTYISKPYKVEELLAAVKTTLQKFNEHENLRNVVSSSLEEHVHRLEREIDGVKAEVYDIKNTVDNMKGELNETSDMIKLCASKIENFSNYIITSVGDVVATKFKDFFGDYKDHLLDHAYIRDQKDAAKATMGAIRKSIVGIVIGAIGTLVVLGIGSWIKLNVMK